MGKFLLIVCLIVAQGKLWGNDRPVESSPIIKLENPWNASSVPSAVISETSKPSQVKRTVGASWNQKTPSQEKNHSPIEASQKNIHSQIPDVSIETFYVQPEKEPNPEDYFKNVYTKEESQSKANEVEKEKYRLKIGDQLYISIYGFSEGDTNRLVTVDMTGSISYLFVNSVPALGKTIDELRRNLQIKIRKLYPLVVVAISAVQLVGDNYTVMGEVNFPGTKPIAGEITVLGAVAQAGGFPIRSFRGQIVDYADLDKAFLSRKGEYLPIDFNKLIREGDTSQNVKMEGGDYIYIPSLLAKEIYVLGEVYRPFVHSYLTTATLMEVISWGKGLTPLASSRIAVIRGALCSPITYYIDFNLMSRGCLPDFKLLPGDIVYVPARRFTTLREIFRAGVRAFVGAFAIEAGQAAYLQLHPGANIRDNFLINPATVIQPNPPVIINTFGP